MWIIKVKGKARIPDYIQLRDNKMILLDYFRADRPLEKFKKYGISNDEKKINTMFTKIKLGKSKSTFTPYHYEVFGALTLLMDKKSLLELKKNL